MDILFNTIGVIGTILFSICAIPSAYEAIKYKTCNYNWPFLTMWLGGELFTMIYVLWIGDYILLFNYLFNFICLMVLIYYNQK